MFKLIDLIPMNREPRKLIFGQPFRIFDSTQGRDNFFDASDIEKELKSQSSHAPLLDTQRVEDQARPLH
jgi:hypothetical protein